jgi:hypothetical protein
MFVQLERPMWRIVSQKDQMLIVAVAITYLLQLLCNNPTLWAFVGMGATIWRIQQMKLSQKLKRIVLASMGTLLIPLLIFQWAQVSDAFLLSRAQDFFSNSFATATGGSIEYTNLIDLIFNSIRGIYLILLAVAGFQSWQDFRQSEEMSSFARMCFGSLVGVFGIDVISTFIVPGAVA